MKQKIAIYAGSFDPPTLGHSNIIERALKIFDQVIVAVAHNTSKQALFSPEEKLKLLKQLYHRKKKVSVDYFDGLLVHYAKKKKATALIRGLRSVADYEYELSMAFTNRQLNPQLETVFLMTESRFAHVSSSLIKEIAYFKGSLKGLVDPSIEKIIRKKFSQKNPNS